MDTMVRLKDGSEVRIRELQAGDLQESLAFFRGLPAEDRIYLRNDVTRREVVAERIRKLGTGKIIRLVAVGADGRIVADGSLESEGFAWKDHVSELRLLVAADYRRKSLGMLMGRELYLAAARKRVEEIVAKVMRPQAAALKVMKRLGFREEATLPDYVKDTAGHKHDLIILRCKLQDLLRELESYTALSDWQRTR